MTIPLESLQSRISGRVLVMTDPDFLTEVTGFTLSATYAPDAAIAVSSDADIV